MSVTSAEKKYIRDRLRELFVDGHKAHSLAAAFHRWWLSVRRPSDPILSLAAGSLVNWAKFDGVHEADFARARWNGGNASVFLRYLREKHPEPSAQQNRLPRATLIHAIEDYFQTAKTMPRDRLQGLIGGPFAMFRRLWSDRKNVEWIIRSIVYFSEENGIFTYREHQKFYDEVWHKHRDEEDLGYLFRFGDNVFVLSKEQKNSVCVKFLSMHKFDPALSAIDAEVNVVYGNLIGISGQDEHPGYRFVLRRIREGKDGELDLEPRLLPVSGLDKITRDYLFPRGKLDFAAHGSL